MHVWSQELYGDSVLSVQFCCEPKTTLKKLFLKMIKQMHHVTWCERRVIKV